jgi:TatA/E family protein of Tat protein translocase
MQELIIILVVALIFIGPKKLPDLAKALGKGVAQFKNAMDDVKGTFDEGIKKEMDQVKNSILEDKTDVKTTVNEGNGKEGVTEAPSSATAEQEKKDKPVNPA